MHFQVKQCKSEMKKIAGKNYLGYATNARALAIQFLCQKNQESASARSLLHFLYRIAPSQNNALNILTELWCKAVWEGRFKSISSNVSLLAQYFCRMILSSLSLKRRA